jgi:hypothetical protein
VGDYLDNPCTGDLYDLLKDFESSDKDRFTATISEVYGGPKEALKFKNDLVRYLKEAPCRKYFLVDSSLETVSQETMEAMERQLSTYKRSYDSRGMVTVKRDECIWKGKGKAHTRSRGRLGGRAVCVSSGGYIPFAEKGTIVGIDHSKGSYHILLDCENDYATNLRKRLKSNRGFVAKKDDLHFGFDV